MAFPLLEIPDRCPGCAATDRFRPLEIYDNAKRKVSPRDRLALVGCERCGLVFTHPLPTEAELDAFYATPDGWEQRMEVEDDVDPDAELERKMATKRDRYGRALEMLRGHLPDAPGRALDFGCGLGAWLDVLQDAGWETCGIEPGPQQRAIAERRHRMVDEPPPGESFDFVVVNHVFEHLRDPLATMQLLAASTAPGGKIFVSVPDFGRLPKHGKWGYVKNERHICSYTGSALESLFKLTGFKLLERLDTPAWDALGPSEPWHLKVIGEMTGNPEAPTGTPLDEALDALRGYEPIAEALAEETRRRAAEKKEARIAAKRAAAEKRGARGEEETAGRGGWARAVGKRLRRGV